MIEEKNIKRLAERDEALKRGFELMLVKDSIGIVYERIKYNKEEFIAVLTTKAYLNRDEFDTCLIHKGNEIPWFDIQPPKMCKMTLVEIHDYLAKEKKILCWKNSDNMIINTSMDFNDIKTRYENHGTLNSDGTFKPLHLVEDK